MFFPTPHTLSVSRPVSEGLANHSTSQAKDSLYILKFQQQSICPSNVPYICLLPLQALLLSETIGLSAGGLTSAQVAQETAARAQRKQNSARLRATSAALDVEIAFKLAKLAESKAKLAEMKAELAAKKARQEASRPWKRILDSFRFKHCTQL